MICEDRLVLLNRWQTLTFVFRLNMLQGWPPKWGIKVISNKSTQEMCIRDRLMCTFLFIRVRTIFFVVYLNVINFLLIDIILYVYCCFYYFYCNIITVVTSISNFKVQLNCQMIVFRFIVRCHLHHSDIKY